MDKLYAIELIQQKMLNNETVKLVVNGEVKQGLFFDMEPGNLKEVLSFSDAQVGEKE